MAATRRERIDALERIIAGFVDVFSDVLSEIHRRVLAVQMILDERKGILTDEEVANKMQALDDAAALEVEYDPKYADFRRLRRLVEEAKQRSPRRTRRGPGRDWKKGS